jgi:putative transposase
MPRRSRVGTGHVVFHVLNRAVQGATLFDNHDGYDDFLRIMIDTMGRIPMRLLAYTLMPNHWHLVLWPDRDDALPSFMKWLSGTHAQSWRRKNGSSGRGAVYQSRYKAIAVQQDAHFLRLCRYVERNATRAKLVASVQDWLWTSASLRLGSPERPALTAWPIPRPENWQELLDTPEPPETLKRLRSAIRAGRHYGRPSWRFRIAQQLRWPGGDRGPGRVWEAAPAEGDEERPGPTSDHIVDFRNGVIR